MSAALTVVRHSATLAVADLRAVYTWRTWTFGWLARMLSQAAFFGLLGVAVDRPGQRSFLIVGSALMTCVVEVMMVIASTSWERGTGTLPLLAAAPAPIGWVFVGRSLHWIASGCATCVVALFVLGPPFGVRWTWSQVPVVVALVVLTAAATYCFGLFLAALVLWRSGIRNIVSNVSYLVLMAVCGVTVPVTFWPGWVQAGAETVPLTHSLRGLRAVVDGLPAATVAASAGMAAALAGLWMLLALAAFRFFVRRGRRVGTFDFGE